MNRFLFFLCLMTFFLGSLRANNVQISAVTVTGGGSILNFTISWDNSWRVLAQPANNDAVWIIVKRRDCASIDFRHQDVSSTLTDHTFGSPLTATTVTDKKGLFIHRDSPGQGNISNVSVSIKLDNPPAGDYDYKVIGIEMVLVPSGAFQLGDGSFANGAFGSTTNNNLPDTILSEYTAGGLGVGSPNTVGPTTLAISGSACGLNTTATLSGAYPKGFNAFYCMKYEISLGQYLDFLNSIPGFAGAGIPAGHGYATPQGGRNPVSGSHPFYTTTTPNRACDSISWFGLLAYLDWAALSPMSEFEFEKACRGLNTAVLNEYAWASALFTEVDLLVNDGTPSEATAITGAGICNLSTGGTDLGVFRCGFAATPTTTTRIEVGGSFYGAMELSGNVAERCVGVASTTGCGGGAYSTFTNVHGDGEVDNAGMANAATWPTTNENFATVRGGAWNMAASKGRVSDRSLVYAAFRAAGRKNGYGGRGVRRAQTGPSTF